MIKKFLLVVAMLCLPMVFTAGCSDTGGKAKPATPAASSTNDASSMEDEGTKEDADTDGGTEDADAGTE